MALKSKIAILVFTIISLNSFFTCAFSQSPKNRKSSLSSESELLKYMSQNAPDYYNYMIKIKKPYPDVYWNNLWAYQDQINSMAVFKRNYPGIAEAMSLAKSNNTESLNSYEEKELIHRMSNDSPEHYKIALGLKRKDRQAYMAYLIDYKERVEGMELLKKNNPALYEVLASRPESSYKQQSAVYDDFKNGVIDKKMAKTRLFELLRPQYERAVSRESLEKRKISLQSSLKEYQDFVNNYAVPKDIAVKKISEFREQLRSVDNDLRMKTEDLVALRLNKIIEYNLSTAEKNKKTR